MSYEDFRREDTLKFWVDTLKNVKHGQMWCSQFDFIANYIRNVTFLYIGDDYDLFLKMKEFVSKAYMTYARIESTVVFMDINNPDLSITNEFYANSVKPTCFWKDGNFDLGDKFIMTKSKENLTREDIKSYWSKGLKNVHKGELWCSQKDYLDNKPEDVSFMFVSNDDDVIHNLANIAFFVYFSEESLEFGLYDVDPSDTDSIVRKEFFKYAKEPTCIWREGKFIAD